MGLGAGRAGGGKRIGHAALYPGPGPNLSPQAFLSVNEFPSTRRAGAATVKDLVLSEHEQALIEATGLGEIAHFAAVGNAKPSIRAEVLRRLLLGLPFGQAVAPFPVRLSGVRVEGAAIEGALDLANCAGPSGQGLPSLELADCDIPRPITITNARLVRLSVVGSRLRAVHGRGVIIDGPFTFDRASPAPLTHADTADPTLGFAGDPAVIDLAGATIHGAVSGEGAELRIPRRQATAIRSWETLYALRLSDAKIAGELRLTRGFKADGGVTISTSVIGGDIWLSGAELFRREGYAFNARAAHIAGAVMMVSGCFARGRIGFRNAEIGADFVISSGDSAGKVGDANARRTAITGEVDLRGTNIRGSLEFGGSAYLRLENWAINAAGVRVNHDIRFRVDDKRADEDTGCTKVSGGLRFDGAVIGGELQWQGLEFRGPGPALIADRGWTKRKATRLISLEGAKIGRALSARSLILSYEDKKDRISVIDLRGAQCSSLDDDLVQGWGFERATPRRPLLPRRARPTALLLEGFTYDRLDPDEGASISNSRNADRWRKRKHWLREHFERHAPFHPQPYTQLARVYANAGWTADLGRVLRALQWRQITARKLGMVAELPNALYGALAGFGYAPARLCVFLALYLVLGWGLVDHANGRNRLIIDVTPVAGPADATTGETADAAIASGVRPTGPPCGAEIVPILYALDVAIPLLDLRQEGKCEPGLAEGIPLDTAHGVPTQSDVDSWRFIKAAYALIGALLTALAVVTFTGIMRRRID